MKVMKFGGTSVKDADAIMNVAEIVKENGSVTGVAVVLSAMKGVTDLLISAARKAEKGDPVYRDTLQEIRAKKKETLEKLFTVESERTEITKRISAELDEIESILHGVELVRECSDRSLDLIMSYGEKMNCLVVSDFLNTQGHAARYVDARELIVTDKAHGRGKVSFKETNQNIKNMLSDMDGTPIITGFIACSHDGATTTLGRNGSDYTASIIGAALNAETVEIWTDVDGVLSADPRFVENAFVLSAVSYQEAMELSYFGAKVIHPFTMLPAVEQSIPIVIKNTFNKDAPGTQITSKIEKREALITGIASIEGVALINIEGSGMVGVPGIASRVFSVLAKADVNIVMISQASSEHSICFVVRDEEADKAQEVLRSELAEEIQAKCIQNIALEQDLEIIAVIGEGMKGTAGISGRLFSSLGEAKVNVLAIAQGSSERNISLVIDRKEREEALKTIHAAFLE